MSHNQRSRACRFVGSLVLYAAACWLALCGHAQVEDQTQPPTRGEGAPDRVAPTPPAATPPTAGRLSGQVVNASTGQPVSRALVRFNDRAILTDYEGKFQFEQISQNGGNLQVIKPGFSSSTEPFDDGAQYIRLSQITGPLRLRLYPEALLTGTVSAANGDPLPGISVYALRSVFMDDVHRWSAFAQSVTNHRGEFRLPVSAGDYKLQTQFAPPSQSSAEAILPVSMPDGSSSFTTDVLRIHSGEEQRFDLKPVTSRMHVVTATIEGMAEGDFPTISARAQNGRMMQINLQPDGVASSGAAQQAGTPRAFQMDLPVGTYTLIASMQNQDGLKRAETSVTVADHDVSGVVLKLSPVPAFPVELVIDGDAASDREMPNLMELGLVFESNHQDAGEGDGTIRLSPLHDHTMAFSVPPGSYQFQARNNTPWYVESVTYGGADLLLKDLVVAPGSNGGSVRVVISNQTGSIEGTVKINGVASAGWVYLVATMPSAMTVTSVRSSADGVYRFAHLAPGSYEVVAFESSHSADYRDPASLAAYTTHVRSVAIKAGDKPAIDLDAVASAELAP